MSGPKRNPDKLNTIGVVVVGICGAVLVYVTIVALQAFYMDDTSEVQMMADYGGQDTQARNTRASQMANLTSPSQPNPRGEGLPQTYRIPLKHAMKYVVDEVKQNPDNVGNLVPTIGPSDRPTVLPMFGRPRPLSTAPAADGTDAADAADAADGADAPAGDAVTPVPTDGEGMGGRSGPVDTSRTPPAPVNLPGETAPPTPTKGK
jgi:hypothetical protein